MIELPTGDGDDESTQFFLLNLVSLTASALSSSSPMPREGEVASAPPSESKIESNEEFGEGGLAGS